MSIVAQAAEPAAHSVVLLVTPGLDPASFSTLHRKLDRGRHHVRLETVPCPSGGQQATVRFLETLDVEDTVVVAHGLAVPWALDAELRPAGWVWVAPVLDVWPSDDQLPPDVVARRAAYTTTVYNACSSPSFASSVSAMGSDSSDPDHVQQVSAPVVALVSGSDDVATVEANMPVLLTSPLTTIRRLGVGGWGQRDLDHTELITTRRGQRQIRRALRLLRRQQ